MDYGNSHGMISSGGFFNLFLQRFLDARSRDGMPLDVMVVQTNKFCYQWMGYFSKGWISGKGWVVDLSFYF